MSAIAVVLSCCLAGSWQTAPSHEPEVDAWFDGYWKKQDLKPAATCDDAVFLRRVSLDLIGMVPSPDEVRAFLKSTKKDKRARKIDELLASPESAEYFAHLWVQWLMGHDIDFRDLRRLDLGGLCLWLKKAWTEDLPYDEFVRAFLSSSGKLSENPPANYLAKHLVSGEPPATLARASARLFLGRDLRCAQCHDHPFDPITQEEFWAYAAFFRPLRDGGGRIDEVPVRKPDPLREDLGERFIEPRFLDGRTLEPEETRAAGLARLFLTMENDAVARALVDRAWRLYFGRSLLPGRHAKGQPELLDLLTKTFRGGKGSLRNLAKTIVGLRAYQLSSEGPEAQREVYAIGPLKMMNTTQFMRVWNHAFQWEPYFRSQYEKNPEKLAFFKDPDVFWMVRTMQAKELLFPKGRDPEEVLASGTDRLAIKLMNNRDIQLMMISQFSLVQQVAKKTADPERRVEELFLLMVSRPPTKAEKARFVEHVRSAGNPAHAYVDGYADLFWMLFNSSEFVFVG
ncbi:MAG: DUF1549 domain-containing protein [Planctomycetaceae bacterium]|nr:DUF1549 domain-containing protein [Planctomycetaceae bacterium]